MIGGAASGMLAYKAGKMARAHSDAREAFRRLLEFVPDFIASLLDEAEVAGAAGCYRGSVGLTRAAVEAMLACQEVRYGHGNWCSITVQLVRTGKLTATVSNWCVQLGALRGSKMPQERMTLSQASELLTFAVELARQLYVVPAIAQRWLEHYETDLAPPTGSDEDDEQREWPDKASG